ncbi:hypothetical protein OIDMADRAFT_60702 [Oidiodendron maius Zn]|uniref:SMP-30/Gluconolactonase/LRE-like region domain-containing protein n=1 Tax=Oidiodendron maius (strain Zn) TaxID=913774 RepID=A0A0C3CXG2_OIDMZ|nr:hypothetical protein OIDMADRAFT_60702 [Oidiodendron maius Zn]
MKAFTAGVVLAASVSAQSSATIYSVATTIPWSPKAPSSVDQSTVYNGTYYLSDRTNAGVHVVSLANNTQTKLITGFYSGLVNGTLTPSISGPDGMIVLPARNELWVGDGDGTVKVIDLFTSTIVGSINTTSAKRADEFGYDPANNIVVVTNPNENPPYVSVISATNRTVIGRIMFPNVTELEQPVFNPTDGLFYVSVPSSGHNPGGSICTLDIATLSIAHTYQLPNCVPAGIVFGPKNHLFIGCSESQITDYGYAASYIMDVSTGNVISNISGLAGIDQVAYDSAANLFYASAYQNLGAGNTPLPQIAVVNASSGTLVQTLPTDNVTAHSVAVDGTTGLMLIPIKSQGIVAYDLKAGVMGSGSSPANGTTTGGAAKGSVEVLMASIVVGIAAFAML